MPNDNGIPLMGADMVQEALDRAPTVKTAPCRDCKLPMEFIEPQRYIENGQYFSTLILWHPEAIVCGNCGAVYTYSLTGKTRAAIDVIQVAKGEPRIQRPM
jgi:hypothetical protein